jgi:CheY-like chemotaxis protein
MENRKRILLVDDSDVDNFINKRLIDLLDLQIDVEIANNGRVAIAYIKESIVTDTVPDLIFLDLNMPVLDGLGFLKEYQSMPSEVKRKIKIVILTSSSNPVDSETLQALGFQDYLTKPLTDPILRMKLKEVYADLSVAGQ